MAVAPERTRLTWDYSPAPESADHVRLRDAYQARRDLLWGYIERAGFVAWRPSGAYYILTGAAWCRR